MFTYTAKSMSLSTDFRMAAPVLAKQGFKVVVKGFKITTDATPAEVGAAIKAAYVGGF